MSANIYRLDPQAAYDLIFDEHLSVLPYDRQEIMKRTNDHSTIRLELPENAFEKAEGMDKAFTDAVVENLSKQYNPMEAISGLKIAL